MARPVESIGFVWRFVSVRTSARRARRAGRIRAAGRRGRRRIAREAGAPRERTGAERSRRAAAAGLPACAVPATAGPYAVSAVLR
ncbi:hypothetical protein ACN4GS_32005, partial [Burkholderia pseudomallei]|uniref:hypothetical protein n=1 Tax=Burkholderia pseudomallei TaxID=28450 RepID=UPI003AF92CAC